MKYENRRRVGPFVKAAFISSLLIWTADPIGAKDKNGDLTDKYLDSEYCGGKCDDGYYSHDIKFHSGEKTSCGPVASAALLADIGCQTLKGRFTASGSTPFYGTHPDRLADIINQHIAKGDGCQQVVFDSRSYASERRYLEALESMTRIHGYPAVALIKRSSGLSLHWVVVGDAGPTGNENCSVTYYDAGYRRKVRCADFGTWAERGYVWPFVDNFSVVLPVKNRT